MDKDPSIPDGMYEGITSGIMRFLENNPGTLAIVREARREDENGMYVNPGAIFTVCDLVLERMQAFDWIRDEDTFTARDFAECIMEAVTRLEQSNESEE